MKVISSKDNRSFVLLIYAEFLYMMGYITLKVSLSLFLKEAGYSSFSTYSIAAASLSLFALTSVIWGYLSSRLPQKTSLIMVGAGLVAVGLGLMTFNKEFFTLLAIAFFTTGGSLYSISFSLTINDHFDCVYSRQQGNQVFQWTLNASCIFGLLALSLLHSLDNLRVLYLLAASSVSSAALLLIVKRKSLFARDKSTKSNYIILSFSLVAIVASCYLLLGYNLLTRYLTIIIFFLVVSNLVWLLIKTRDKGYLTYLFMLLLGGCIYRLSFAIFSMQLPIFLPTAVSTQLFGIKISPLALLILDPVANVSIGLLTFLIYKRYALKAKTLISVSLLMNFLAFAALSAGLGLTPGSEKLSLTYPVLAIFLYGGAEFILMTTLIAQISNLVKKRKLHGVFLRSEKITYAFSASVAYYLVKYSGLSSAKHLVSHSDNLHLFLSVAGLTLISFIGCCLYIM